MTAAAPSSVDDERVVIESRRKLLEDRFLSRLHRLYLDLCRTGELDADEYDNVVVEWTVQISKWQEEFFAKPKGAARSSGKQRSDAEKKRATESYERRKAQFLFRNDRKRLAREVFEDTSDPASFTASEIHNYWSALYSVPNDKVAPEELMPASTRPCEPTDFDSRTSAEADESGSEMQMPISPADVLAAHKGMASQPATGLDKLRLATIRTYDPLGRFQSIICSIAYKAKRLPSAWRQLKTVIIPKTGKDPHAKTNRRPITLSQMLRRVYTRIVKGRLRPYIATREDVVDNVFMLRSVLRLAKQEKRQAWVVLLDLSKAFDKVGHAQLITALERAGTPEHLVDVVASLYDGATTTICHKGVTTKPIAIKRGILQGCSTSPDIFTNAIAFVSKRLNDEEMSRHGFSITPPGTEPAEKLVDARFVDDISAIADNFAGACALTDETIRLFDLIDMNIGLPKCFFFTVNAEQSDIDAFAARYGMTHVDEDEFTRYLGAQVGVAQTTTYSELSEKLGNRCQKLLEYEHLRSRQKLALAQQCITSLLNFPSQTDFDAFIQDLPSIDALCKAVKHLYRSVIGLNGTSLPDALLFAPKTAGFFGLPNPKWNISLNGATTAIRVGRSPDARVGRIAARLHVDFRAIAERHLEKLKDGSAAGIVDDRFLTDAILIIGDQKKMKTRRISGMLRDATLRQWSTAPSGFIAGITLPIKRPSSLAWIASPSISDKALNFGVKSLVGLLPLRTSACMRSSQADTTTQCRGCGAPRETPSHVLGGECPVTNGQAIARHDDVLARLVERLEKNDFTESNGWKTTVDLPVRDAAGQQITEHARRSDLILSNERLDRAYVLDVAICYESSQQTLTDRAKGKVDKYEYIRRFLLGEMEERPARCFKEVIVAGLVFGARGFIPIATTDFLTLHFRIDDIWPDLSVALLKRTHAMHGHFQSIGH